MKKDQEDRLWVLLAKRKSGESNEAEEAELNGLLGKQDAPDIDLDLLNRLWHIPLHKETFTNERKKKRYSLVSLAAAVVVVAGVSLFFFFHSGGMETIRPLNALKTHTILPDGTGVWLHQHSSIRYDQKNFGKKERNVYVTGEAFFDVHKDKNKPMNVYAGNVVIRVLGTAFNVKSLDGKDEVETSLIRGSVEVYLQDNPTRKISLKPSQKVITSAATNSSQWNYQLSKVETSTSEPPLETIWLNRQLIFDNESFDQLAPKLERWFNVNITFRDETVKKLRFSAVIEKETLLQTLEAMKLSAPFTYSLSNKELRLEKLTIMNTAHKNKFPPN